MAGGWVAVVATAVGEAGAVVFVAGAAVELGTGTFTVGAAVVAVGAGVGVELGVFPGTGVLDRTGAGVGDGLRDASVADGVGVAVGFVVARGAAVPPGVTSDEAPALSVAASAMTACDRGGSRSVGSAAE
ncbi:hypothetical protein [Candidatus Amarobacter glycogenicus]|uniref:hypothetical protein n=1 Tax=Candidatus Amarobacter glycogenicus TaxID=3140699 RepID=UPI003135BCFD|nr:hypothetical protein [Dehalococcoidia bacterium]